MSASINKTNVERRVGTGGVVTIYFQRSILADSAFKELFDEQEGEVESVSPDAVIDEARGLVFPARIRITGSKFRSLGNESEFPTLPDNLSTDYTSMLTPGLSAAVEIKTGKRSVLSYLLSPVARSVSEAGRER